MIQSPRFSARAERLRQEPSRWLVTGAAGFIGSHVCEALARLGQEVIGLDDLSNGSEENLARIREAGGRFEFVRGDVRDADVCRRVSAGARYVLHQAAMGSVPRSLEHPLEFHDANVTGFVNALVAAREAGVERFVYASSSSVYGDAVGSPKREAETGRPLSPYAATKAMDEIYAETFARCYGTPAVGLRYFNVFGPRQRPDGPYAAVIPRWIRRMIAAEDVEIYGDGATSRDFCYVDNVAQANILAATEARASAHGRAFNVACGQSTSLERLFALIRDALAARGRAPHQTNPIYKPFRPGDIRDSLADVGAAREAFGYEPVTSLEEGVGLAVDWHLKGAPAPHQEVQR